MNLTLEQADWVRARRAAGDAVIGLVVEGEWPKACPLADPTECNGEHCDCSLRPPADWVALTGVCETCEGTGHYIDDRGEVYEDACPDSHCIDGRERATLTEFVPWTDDEPIAVPLAVATVGVLSVYHTDRRGPERAAVVVAPSGVFRLDRNSSHLDYDLSAALDRTPTPGVDFVVLLSDVVDA